MPRRYTDFWTPEEDQLVIDLRKRGRTIASIAVQLERRSWSAVHQRVRMFEDDGTVPKMSLPWGDRRRVVMIQNDCKLRRMS